LCILKILAAFSAYGKIFVMIRILLGIKLIHPTPFRSFVI
jgi:hypothetical protein